jgi:hypothetical protein
VSQSPLISTPGNFAAAGSRRSTRIEKSVPLIVLGQNQMGEPFMERTVAVTLNMHGCRYPSRHDYGVGTWVTLQVVGLLGAEEKPANVRAIVRSVHPPGSLRELQQVGVELETPANVWGIAPPGDWLTAGETNTATAQVTGVVATVQKSAAKKEGEILMKPDSKLSDIASVPSPSPAASQPAATATPKVAEAPQPPRVVVTPAQLIAGLQGKLQQEAEKAVQAAVAKQLNDAVREALGSIEDARRSGVREVQEIFPKQLEAMKLSLKADMQMYRSEAQETAQRLEKQADESRRELAKAQEYGDKLTREIAGSIPDLLKETVTQARSDFESATVAITERRYELLVEDLQNATQDALSKLNTCSAEVKALVQSAVDSGLDEFRREAEKHAGMALADTKERAVSWLSSLDEESRTACDARRQALETEVARSAERAAEEFHKRIKAFLYTSLVAAVDAVDEHSKSTLDGLLKDDGKTLGEALSRLKMKIK